MKQERTPAFALDQTLAAYGIRKLPFPIDEVDDFYFATPTLAKQSDSLRSLIEYSDLILVVSGVEGAGKSEIEGVGESDVECEAAGESKCKGRGAGEGKGDSKSKRESG